MSVLELDSRYQPACYGPVWGTTTADVDTLSPFHRFVTGDSRGHRPKRRWYVIHSGSDYVIASEITKGVSSLPTQGSFAFHGLLKPVDDVTTSTAGDPDPLADFYSYNQPNWDGYEANPIKRSTIAATRMILAMIPNTFGNPHIAPGADGTIGFEWLLKTGPLVKLFIDIGPGFTWSAYWRRRDGEVGKYMRRSIEIFQTRSILAQLFKRLSV